MAELDPEAIKLVNQALEVLKNRKVTHDYCPRCETFDWDVEPISIAVTPLRGIPAATPHAYSPAQILLLQIVCRVCGYTMFHNLNILGLAPQTRR
jgi:hypothetical protein